MRAWVSSYPAVLNRQCACNARLAAISNIDARAYTYLHISIALVNMGNCMERFEPIWPLSSYNAFHIVV